MSDEASIRCPYCQQSVEIPHESFPPPPWKAIKAHRWMIRHIESKHKRAAVKGDNDE